MWRPPTAGDIVAIAGIPDVSIGETITDLEHPMPLPTIHIDEPTIKMTFSVNTSPFRGKEGKFTTSRNFKDRLEKELETDVALAVTPTEASDRWVVAGRGELHLAILIEKMRREGFELEVSKPQVIFKEEDGKKTEPMELVSIEVPEAYSGTVIEMMGKRLGRMKNMRVDDKNNAFMDFEVPTRGLIGIRNKFLTSTKGTGIMNTIFLGYEPYKGDITAIPHGSIVATQNGVSNNYGLVTAQGSGTLFISAGVAVYEGMVVGENAKEGDVLVHVAREKELTNFRAKNEGLADQLEVPRHAGARRRAGLYQRRRARGDHAAECPHPEEISERKRAQESRKELVKRKTPSYAARRFLICRYSWRINPTTIASNIVMSHKKERRSIDQRIDLVCRRTA